MSCRGLRGVLVGTGAGLGLGLLGGCGSTSSTAQAPATSFTSRTAPATNRCVPRGAHVVALSHESVVYTVPSPVRSGPVPGARAQGSSVFGCVIGVWKRVRLGTATHLEKVTLNRTTLAYAASQIHGIDTSATRVSVADVRRGHELYAVPAGRIAIAPSFVSVDTIAVTPGGTVAWIQHGGTVESSGYSVHGASVAKPSDHRLAAGTAINPGSLRLSGAAVSWVDGGQRRSARI